ncbi:MAG: hypothetical protein JW953_22525 [Anaerolineae bacterium]|nr:hypothetical protein [Anaerolineae bacterium]
MLLRGTLLAESPIYRGNARKTLFTRDGDGTQRLVSLAGEIQGTAQALMDAFIGESRDGRNTGLLNQLWQRLYNSPLPRGLITKVDCKLQKEAYPRDNFFDLRMGVRLDEDRWAIESNANYKMETLYRNSTFDFSMAVDDGLLQKNDNQARLYYVLQELQAGRFWFGAGKSKGLGRCRLDIKLPFAAPENPPALRPGTNHLRLALTFKANNPLLVGWNWGKVDPDVPAFAAIDGRVLVAAMRDLPDPIRSRLEMSLSGPILSPEDWKQKLAEYLPRVIAIWLQERSSAEAESLVLPASALKKLGKGKFGLSAKVLEKLEPLVGQPFSDRELAEAAVTEALADKANMANRVLDAMEVKVEARHEFDQKAWQSLAAAVGMEADLGQQLTARLDSEAELVEILRGACRRALPRLYDQIDQQIHLLQSDAWVDAEIASRTEHLRVKQMLLQGKINEQQWHNRHQSPQGISDRAWRDFLDSHSRVRFKHLLSPVNLRKSIANDENFIAFLQAYRDRTRQELAQPQHIDFRAGGIGGREMSKKYGKPYDTVFMRMLSWSPGQDKERWEVYIPGSTIKGAFRKRASQVLKTLWGESGRTKEVLENLFGAQRRRGLAFFSDAYLVDPQNPDRAWCSMDGVKMNPSTGQPIEQAKSDYLFAYGEQLVFQLRLDLQDIQLEDLESVSLLLHLLQDFQKGDIPLGGEKSSGFGWVQANVADLTWLTAGPDDVGQQLFGKQALTPAGVWQKLELKGQTAADALPVIDPLKAETKVSKSPPQARAGFISHRAFGGYCGSLAVEATILTPISIRESGEPSFTATLSDGPSHGYDFFALAPPEAALRNQDKTYALPSKSLRGMLRHIYAIASNSIEDSPDIGQLNPTDSLFGWVGRGPNQSLMSRLVFNFGLFESPELAWFKTPYPYGGWKYQNGQWQKTAGNGVPRVRIGGHWRVFPHTPLAPIVEQMADFQPDTAQANYCRAILPGARARFEVRFWNLTEAELQRLAWCVALEPELAHKMGQNRYLGFGSLRLRLLPDSFLVDWTKRYDGGPDPKWRLPFEADQWLNPKVIEHYAELTQALNAKQL